MSKRLSAKILLSGLMLLPTAIPLTASYNGYPLPLSASAEGYISRASDFASREMWDAAADQLQTLLTRGSEIPSDDMAEVSFILGNVFSHTGNPRCLQILNEFIRCNPSSPLLPSGLMAKGDFYFYAGQYPEACEVYSQIDPATLPLNWRSAEIYRYALSMIKSGLVSEARPLLSRISGDKEYAVAALFYDAYIDYAEKKYESAYEKFSRISVPVEKRSNRQLAQRLDYRPTGLEAGYYLVQLDYLMGNYERAVNTGLSLEKKTPVEELLAENERAIGLSYYKLGEWDDAFPILKEYVDSKGEDAYYEARYALATILYSRGETDAAAHLFETLTGFDDAVGQSSLVYMGQIASQRGEESLAAISFEKATRMSFDRKVSETALYNYVVARTRGGNIPFNTSVDLLEQFLRLYPNSQQAPIVEQYLATTYYNNNDFESALRSIERIAHPAPAVNKIKQKILYELGMRQLGRGNSKEAIVSLNRAIAMKDINPGLLCQAELWLADAYSTVEEWEKAAAAYTRALKGNLGDNRGLALYGKGYALCALQRFKEALPVFTEASKSTTLSAPMRSDASLRAADCKLYLGNVAQARDEFASLARTSGPGADYAAWRYASILGLQNDRSGKIAQLEKAAKNPVSRWTPEILLDLSQAYLEEKDSNAAIPLLKRLVKDFPKSSQAATANSELRNLYASAGELYSYSEFLESISSPYALKKDEVEQLSFSAAADIFNSTGKVERLEKYLTDFPSGANTAEAHYMAARGYETIGDSRQALHHYRALEKSNLTDYVSIAALGVMRNASDPRELKEACERVLQSGGLDPSVNREARSVLATALKGTGNTREAMEIWKDLSADPSDVYGARSAVSLAQALVEAGRSAEAEKVLNEFIDSPTSQSYWLARGYIALSDILTAQGKKYVARQYLESLRDNYPGDELEIHDMISKRLK